MIANHNHDNRLTTFSFYLIDYSRQGYMKAQELICQTPEKE